MALEHDRPVFVTDSRELILELVKKFAPVDLVPQHAVIGEGGAFEDVSGRGVFAAHSSVRPRLADTRGAGEAHRIAHGDTRAGTP